MNLSELSDEDLSRWIATKLEPKPVRCTPQAHESVITPRQSSGRCWVFGYGNDDSRMPCNMISDPAMSDLLLEQMPAPHLWKNRDGTWYCDPDSGGDGEYEACHLNRKRAIAEAFKKWKESL